LTGCAETAYDVFLGTKEVKAESSIEERHGGVDALTDAMNPLVEVVESQPTTEYTAWYKATYP
jgi:hypothetical protein